MNSWLSLLANAGEDIEGDINALSIRAIGIATIVLVVLLVIASQTIKKKKFHYLKEPLFILIAATIVLPSLLLVGSTIYINTISESKGPVHWHTDIEFWVCGQEIELRDPYQFLSNKIGTATYHEHDDKRIHLEGVVIEKEYDASLEKFMDVTGGKISTTEVVIPTNEDPFENDVDGDQVSGDEQVIRDYMVRDADERQTVSLMNGNTCGDGQPGEVQAFLLRYNIDNDTYTQTKLENPARYIMRDESIVPPGDCVIVEFGPSRNATDKLCEQYGVRDEQRCTEFGVSEFNPELCNISQELNPEDLQPNSQRNLETIEEQPVLEPSDAEVSAGTDEEEDL